MRSRAAGERPNEFISLTFVSVTEFGGFNGAESHKVFSASTAWLRAGRLKSFFAAMRDIEVKGITWLRLAEVNCGLPAANSNATVFGFLTSGCGYQKITVDVS